MWIPYFLFEFWEPETDSKSITASQSDNQEREFFVYFYLENPPARVRSVELLLTQKVQKLQTDGTGRQASLRFEPNDKNELDRVGFKIRDVHPKLAFTYCYDQLSQLLSFWTVVAGSGFSIFGVKVLDEKNKARWKVVPQRAAPEPFEMPSGISVGDAHSAVLSLYREARNTQSPYYRFLCCYKILEALYRSRSLFGFVDHLVKEKGLPFTRPRRTITEEMLVTSLVFESRPEFKNKNFREFFGLLNPWRIKVAHAVTDSGQFINFDKYGSQVDIGPIANLVDLVARQILLDEMDMWRQLNDARVIQS
ncbi:MAG: methylamine utilization protein MauJ [Deltaproteobacteria bacterium]|nr:methylamine utilization protein MauJ [Deltaproteobacteria bacterium]